MSKTKHYVLILSLALFVFCGMIAVVNMDMSARTYDGSSTPAMALYEDPSSYDNSNADGAAAVIVNENLEKTASLNAVFSVVFNFRGYDTLGESFILIGALSGSMVILRKVAKRPEIDREEELTR